jgi:membrane protease YdiL (CAAX protease family)
MEKKEQHIHITRLQRVKCLLIPLIALGLILVFLFLPELQPAWGGLHEFTTLSHSLQVRFFVIVVGGGVGMIFFAEIVGRVKIKYHHLKIRKITFTAALRQRNLTALFILYPVTLFIEECLFRGLILLGFLQILPQGVAILISALIFGLYHFHIFLTSRDIGITGLFMVISFILGLLLGPLFLYYGIWGCFLYHLVVISVIYLRGNKTALNQEKKGKKD